jgi:hypothetical protein
MAGTADDPDQRNCTFETQRFFQAMSDVSSLHSHCMRLILSLREGLEKLEEAESRRSGDCHAKAVSLRVTLNELQVIMSA